MPGKSVQLDRRILLGVAAVSGLYLSARRVDADTPSAGFASWTGSSLVLDNGRVRRVIALPTAQYSRLSTIDFRPVAEASKLFTGHAGQVVPDAASSLAADEFAFTIDGRAYGAATKWRLTGIEIARDDHQGSGAEVTLVDEAGTVAVSVRYLLYPDAPVVRKRVTVHNLSHTAVRLENIDVESFVLEAYYPSTMGWIYSDYGRRKSLAPFKGTRQDSLVALHVPDWGQGLVLGNEAPGVMKYTGIDDGAQRFHAGLARSTSELPFRRWLKPDQSYAAPQVFSIVYTATPRFETVLNSAVPDFVRRHMGVRLSAYARKPSFVFNTWEPFEKNINEALIMEVAAAAAAAGAKTFVIDDGWQDLYGDWNVDRTKFPNGLKPVMTYIKSLGMKPGLWVSIGSAEPHSQVFKAHPEWFVRNPQGTPYSIHADGESDKVTACMSTGWRGYIGGLLDRLVSEHGLEYMKLDFAVVTSPYQFDTTKTGCYATDHPGHRDQPESLSVNYDYLWDTFDRFKAKNPDVFIDCTFETMGGIQLIDYAMLQHAEGNWLANFDAADQANDLRVRNMAWWRSPAMPATSLVIGNTHLNDAKLEMHLRSLAGSLPIFLGDPRAMTPDMRALSKRYADFFAGMQARHDIFSFRQDLDGFGEPGEGAWDGFQRVNTETGSGGLVGIFRHGATETKRLLSVAWLDPARTYRITDIYGKQWALGTGRQLRETGFEVELPDLYDGRLFEVAALS